MARNNLNQLKDAYTKLFEDYNELQEEKKKKEVQNDEIIIMDQLLNTLCNGDFCMGLHQLPFILEKCKTSALHAFLHLARWYDLGLTFNYNFWY